MYVGEKKYNKRVLFIQAQPYFIYVKVFDKYEIMILTDIDMFIDYVYIFLVKFFLMVIIIYGRLPILHTNKLCNNM